MVLDRFKRRKTSDLAKEIARQEFQKERLRQAKLTGAAKAKVEGEARRKAIKDRAMKRTMGVGSAFRSLAENAARSQGTTQIAERKRFTKTKVKATRKKKGKRRVTRRQATRSEFAPTVFGPEF